MNYKMQATLILAGVGSSVIELIISESEKEHFEIALNDEEYLFIVVEDIKGVTNWLKVDNLLCVTFEEVK